MLFAPTSLFAANGIFGGGAGTSTNPYIVEDAADLNAMRNGLSLHYKLGGNIDLTDYLSTGQGFTDCGSDGWLPIGINIDPNQFIGSLDGGDYTISGLWINRNTAECVGLFGCTRNATIRNLAIELAPTGVIGYNYVGGLVGLQEATNIGNRSNIDNCSVNGSVEAVFGNVGCFIGRQNSYRDGINTITNCNATGTVNNGQQVGGFIGSQFADDGGLSTIDRCFADVNVSSTNYYVGGLVGRQYTDDASSVCNIINSYAKGNVINGTRVGGLVGYQESKGYHLIENCYATGNVTPSGDFAGGLVGYQYAVDGDNMVRYCYATGNVISSEYYVGGLIGYQHAADGNNASANSFAVGELTATNFIGGLVSMQVIGSVGTGTNTITDNYRYLLAKLNGAPILATDGQNGHNLRHGDNSTTAVGFMTRATYVANGWTFGGSGPWYWDDNQKFPMLLVGTETYPFPFYAIAYDEDGGTLPADAHISYEHGETYTLPSIDNTRYQYHFDGWLDDGNTLVNGITATDTGHKLFRAKWTKYIFDVTITPTTGGSVTADKLLDEAGETITLTITPNVDYVIKSILVHNTGDVTDVVSTSALSNTLESFVMPSNDVTVTVEFERLYYVTIINSGGGSVVVSNSRLRQSETAQLTLTSFLGYEFASISATGITFGQNGNNFDFTMPANDVLVYANFQKTARQLAWENARSFIENALFVTDQNAANTERHLQYVLADIINELIAATGFVVLPNDIVIFSNFVSATEGDEDHPNGTDGSFEFRVTPPDVLPSAYSEGTITATPYDTTPNDYMLQKQAFKAGVKNGRLYVSGLTAGQSWSVYAMSGVLVYERIATGAEADIVLPARGIYIVRSGAATVKIIY